MLHDVPGLRAELIHIIVNDGEGERILKFARGHGVKGGTIALGRGTANSRVLDFIGWGDVRKDIVYLVAEEDLANKILAEMDVHFQFHKPNHGIAFTTTVCEVVGSRNIACDSREGDELLDSAKYHVINVIVDKGKAEDVIAAAEQAGSKGGTVINARGAGVHEISRVFSMDIEPEKEVVLILSRVERTDQIVDHIRKELKIDEPGNGIIFLQTVNRAYGVPEGTEDSNVL